MKSSGELLQRNSCVRGTLRGKLPADTLVSFSSSLRVFLASESASSARPPQPRVACAHAPPREVRRVLHGRPSPELSCPAKKGKYESNMRPLWTKA